MRKFLIKLFMAALPFIVYLTIFVVFEPYNYWGLKEVKSGNWTTPLARVREYLRHPSSNVIIGDSRMNHFDMNRIEELTGEKWINLSTGGQGINLTYEMFRWANQRQEVKKCLIDTSFYQLKPGSRSPSAEAVFFIADHPLQYISTYDYVAEAWDEMLIRLDLKERPTRETEHTEEIDRIIRNDDKYRDDLLEYALYNIYKGVEDYSIDEESYGWIESIVNDVDENNGEMMILLPCVQESIWEYVIEPIGIESYMDDYKSSLSQLPCTVYDMEWISPLSRNQDVYADGFHFKSPDLYQKYYTNDIFGIPDDNVHVIRGAVGE